MIQFKPWTFIETNVNKLNLMFSDFYLHCKELLYEPIHSNWTFVKNLVANRSKTNNSNFICMVQNQEKISLVLYLVGYYNCHRVYIKYIVLWLRLRINRCGNGSITSLKYSQKFLEGKYHLHHCNGIGFTSISLRCSVISSR